MSLLKKFYPRSPEPYIGKRLGDNYVAKLADLNELVDAIEELYANTPPGSGLSSVAVNAPLTGTGTISSPITLSGSVAGTDFDVQSVGSGITIAKNSGSFGTGPINIQATDILKINVQSIPNGLNWEGQHSTANAYQLNDVVFRTVGGIYYSYWCYNPSGAPVGAALPPTSVTSNTYWAQLGLQGPSGISGATWYSGLNPTGGVDNDYFLTTSGINAGLIFKKNNGAWQSTGLNITGPQGPTGSAGAKWFDGTTIPTSGTGVDGDFYLRSDGVVWRKNSGSWSATSINLKGANGLDGTDSTVQGPAGPAGPTNSIVRLYQRTATSTTPIVSTSGITTYTFATNGASGVPSGWSTSIPASGNPYIWEIQAVASNTGTSASINNTSWSAPALIGVPGTQGNNGTAAGFGTPTATSLAAGSSPTVNASGPDTAKVFAFGIPAGATGAAGTDGKTVLSGAGTPAAGTGAIGDFYINTAANTIYGPKTSGGWGSSPTSLIGPQGPAGTAKTVIAFTVDGYGAPIVASNTQVFKVTVPFSGYYDKLIIDAPTAPAGAASISCTVGGLVGGNQTATITGTANSSTVTIGTTPGAFAANATITFTVTASPTSASTYLFVTLSGQRS